MQFHTARSGGKGGQNVNKVETMVEGYFHPESSGILTADQKRILLEKRSSKLNSEGVEKMNQLLEKALIPVKKRIATKASKASKEKRLESKKKWSGQKANRKKITPKDL